MFTPLHRALGIEPCPLTMDVVRRAVTDGITEREDLDWKKTLPQRPGAWIEEFAKDIAAMANASGGMIVYGVSEDRATSAAAEVCGVGPVTDAVLRELRAAAFSGITPPVLGLDPKVIEDPGSGETVLALVIPASEDSPHLVFRQDMFGAPLRLGSQTGWMKERMLESAYRQRFAERDRRMASLDDLFDETARPFLRVPRVWMVAVAQPEIRGRLGRLERNTAHRILSDATEQSIRLAPRNVSPLDQLQGQINGIMPGLRRWIVQSSDLDADQIYGCRIALHFDGSVTIAMAVAGDRQNDARAQVPTRQIEAVLAELAGIAVTTSRELSISGGYGVKASLLGNGTDPIRLLEPDQTLTHHDVAATSPIVDFIPVTGMFPTEDGPEPIREGLREIALDLINQAGARSLHLLTTLAQ
jgi:hypothetical protein